MERRNFLAQASAIAGAAVVTSQAHAQTAPSVVWRMTTSWPKSLDTIYGSAVDLAKRVSELTEGKFEIKVFAGGEIVPAPAAMEAVSSGTVEACHTLASYAIGKDVVLAFDAGMPFGLNSRQHNAWMAYGGGLELMREQYKKHNIVNFVAGNVGVQMGGFFRKEIKSVTDLSGLKMRIGGIGGMVFAKLGAVPQQIPAGEIYSSLEKGTIDAAEWIGPYDDEKLGLYKVAQHYYAPGWWEGSASITAMVGTKAWAALPANFKAAFEVACAEQTVRMLAEYDARNPDALKKMIARGTKLAQFPREVMDAAYKASEELAQELSAKNPEFKAIHQKWHDFQINQASWFRIAESSLDNYTFNAVTRRKP